ncbi:MobC family plasmid mobilization relaxosome protein [Bifidobacterium sp. B4142]|uniref:MobC family plasmid mobilization relaxosome protein n=1 Tax=Bifidobacterium sp. B4142 TaxID=2817962 RepID=UPI00226B7947|nr:MobC family plasmid mobilization relaxosome protein [Bifidobacterium sp. B4142]MCX8686578.1 MobC family plasmid mobilization relaxosome protein [Bifidobacterium sp. B4142]
MGAVTGAVHLVKGGRGYATCMRFARDMLMHGSVHIVRVATDQAAFRPDIARIGNNINQIAHTANATGAITPEQVAELMQGMDRIRAILLDLHHDFTTSVTEGWH